MGSVILMKDPSSVPLPLHLSLSLFTLVLLACPLASTATSFLGPGRLPWDDSVSSPEHVGLDYLQLKEASNLLNERIPQRSCFLVAKGGKLIFEEYSNDGGRDKRVEMVNLHLSLLLLAPTISSFPFPCIFLNRSILSTCSNRIRLPRQ